MIKTYSDAEILQKIRLGIPSNAAVVGWLYDQIRPQIYSIGISMGLTNEEDIRDLTQDVIEAFYRQVMEDRFRGESSILSYLYAIAKNKCVDRLRKSRELLYDPRELAESGEEWDEQSPEALVILAEKTRLWKGFLGLLPEKCQRTLQLYFSPESPSREQMARELGLGSSQAVANAIYRCKKKLAQLILNDPILLGRLMDSFNDPFGLMQALIRYADDFNAILAFCRGDLHDPQAQQTMEERSATDPALAALIQFLRERL